MRHLKDWRERWIPGISIVTAALSFGYARPHGAVLLVLLRPDLLFCTGINFLCGIEFLS